MKLLYVFLLFMIFTCTPAHASTLQFSASVQNEELAEEAIALLHCLIERSGDNWEFTAEANGAHSLRVKEEAGLVRGTYFHNEKEQGFTLKIGQSEDLCAQLSPTLAPAQALNTNPGSPELPSYTEVKTHSYWPWAVAAGAAVIGGFFLLRSSGPDHRGLLMN